MGLFYKTIEEFAENCRKKNADNIEVTLYPDFSLMPFDNSSCSVLSGDVVYLILASYSSKDKKLKSREILEKIEISGSDERTIDEIFAERVKELKPALVGRLEKTGLNYSFK